ALPLAFGQDLVDVAFELRFAEVAELDRHQVAVQTQHRRNADREVHVGAALRQAELQERIDSCHLEPYDPRITAACCPPRRARCAAPPSTRSASTCRRPSP